MNILFVRNRNDCAIFPPYLTFNVYKDYASSLTSSKLQEKCKDTKRVIRNRISKKDRQYNYEKGSTNNDLQSSTEKTKDQ